MHHDGVADAMERTANVAGLVVVAAAAAAAAVVAAVILDVNERVARHMRTEIYNELSTGNFREKKLRERRVPMVPFTQCTTVEEEEGETRDGLCIFVAALPHRSSLRLGARE